MAPSRSDKVDVLARIPLFAGFSDQELGFAADRMSEIRVPEGTVLTEQGAIGDEAMIITSGSAAVRCNDRIVDEMGPGDFFGEMSLVNHEPRSATVTAMSDLTALVMNSHQFSSILEANPKLAIKILRTVAARFSAGRDRGTL